MQLAYQYGLYPSRAQEQKLLDTLDRCRWLYNRLLEELNRAKTEGRKIGKLETQAMIVKLKREKPELKSVYSKVLQMVSYQLWSNIRALSELKKKGRKVGRLRFKGQGWYKTLNYNQSGFRLDGKKLVLSKVGEIPIKLHCEVRGKIKGIIVKHERSGKWFAIFQVEDEPKPLSPAGKTVGMDMGIKHFLTDTDGRQIQNPKFYECSLEIIKIRHRQLSKKEKGSKNRERARIRLARAYEGLVDQRNDFLHKLSHFYVQNYDVMAVEGLNIAGMAKNRNLAQRILDASWGKFLCMLFYKAERAGRQFVEVDPRGTSQEYKRGELDRDYNAALNVLERGLVGLGWPELTPVEIELLLRVPASAVIAGQVPSLKQEAPCESWG